MTSQIKITLESVDNGYVLTVVNDGTACTDYYKASSIHLELASLVAATTKAVERAEVVFKREDGNLV